MKIRTLAGKALRTFTALAMAATMLVAVPSATALAAELTGDYYIVASSTAADDELTLAELAAQVNAGESFAGKTIILTSNANYSGVPIGTSEDAAFEGTFEGNGYTVNLSMTSTTAGRTENIGLFGYVGAGGSIANLNVDGTVTVTASSTVVRNVGSVAGFVYGTIGTDSPALSGCVSTAQVTVESTMDADEADAVLESELDATIEEGVTDEYRTIERVGGMVGYCAGSIDSCEYYGDLTVTSHAAPNEENATLANNIGGIAGLAGGYVITRISDSDSLSTYEPFYPTGEGAYVTDPGEDGVQAITNCINGGSVTTTVDGEAGLDRFGEATTAKLIGVGGIVGYSMANVSNCVNEEDGYVNSESGDGTGGIVGNLRGVPFTGTSGTAVSDAGTYADHDDDTAVALEGPTLTVSNCENYADIVALHAGGGIVGSAGTYTEITTSFNLGSNVCGMRWNKPMCGGIAGQVFGDIYLCYNRADVESYTKGGYYMGGIVGNVTRYTTESGDDVDSPVPEVHACYNTGDLLVTDNMKQAGIVGQNSGFVYDCINTGAVGTDLAVADDDGTTTDTVYMYDDVDDLKTKDAVAILNASLTVEQFEAGDCFVPAVEVDGSTLNDGYPLLDREKAANGYTGETTIDESKVAFAGTGSASYSAVLNPVPTLSATYDGDEFVQYADYYVLPDEDALGEDGICQDIEDIEDTVFYASIVGMGEYTGGTSSVTAPYTIGKTSFDTCTVYIASKTYNGINQYPSEPTDDSSSDVIISDAAGNTIPVSNYTMEEQGSTSRIDYKAAGYTITFTANDDSNYTGTVDGTFMIEKANIIGDAVSLTGFKCQDVTFYWHEGNIVNGGHTTGYLYYLDEDGNEVEGMYATYTGESIKPTISGKLVFTKGDGTTTNLKYGTDYKLVYGDPGSGTDASEIYDDTDDPNINVTEDAETGERACVTLRAVAGNSCNFTNYQNFFFEILPASIADDCEVYVQSSVTSSDGTAEAAVEVYFGDDELVEGTDYELSYETDLSAGTGTVTVTGIGNFTDTVQQSFTIVTASDDGSLSGGADEASVSLAAATVKLKASKAVYTGKKIKVGVASVTLSGAKLAAGTDYKVSYSNNKAIGKATVKVTGTGSYTGTAKATFKIVPAKVTKLSVKAGKKGTKKLTATWKKGSGGVKYQVAWRVKGTKKWKTATAGSAKKVLKKLKKGKTYQVRVRAFKKASGTKYYGAWSSMKKAKVK